MNDSKRLIFIPTYNEAENVRVIFEQIMALNIDTDLLFLDDNSPDGTGDIIDGLARNNRRVFVIHRAGKLGIGSAHQEGIRWAYERGYTQLITMDCDFSHSPSYLKEFIRLSDGCDIVVGSRYMDKDSLKEWNLYRKILTKVGHFLTDTLLKMPYDATGAFRLYNLKRIAHGIFDLVQSKGYSFFFESLYILHLNKCSICEFSIHLPTRTYGHSKMTLKGAANSFKQLLRIYFKTLTERSSLIYAQPLKPVSASFSATTDPYVKDGLLNPAQVQSDWETYWNKEHKSTNIIYDLIAVFYRVFIIRRILDHFIKKHFATGSKILHAGCGSGQVDSGVAKWANITAMDISLGALNIYRRSNPSVEDVVHGDIFHMPFPADSFDGIYNLGVMEHFTEKEIETILGEFNRVLKPGGRMVILVPPEHGLSVIFLKGVHFILNDVLKKNIQLHPAEISRPRNKEHARQMYEHYGLRLVDYYFGPKDVFTYAVIVLQKEMAPDAAVESDSSSHSIVVTGATGFIGRRLIKLLIEQYGRQQIVCLVRPQIDSEKEQSGRNVLTQLGVAVCEGDLLTAQGLTALPRSPRLVFHLASCTDTAQKDHSINDRGTRNLLEALGPLGPRTHFILTSSIAVNDGPRDEAQPMRESTPTPARPFHIYGRKKLLAEQYLTEQSRAMGFRLSIVRVSGVFGPDTIEQGLYTSLRRLVLRGSWLSRLNWPGRVSSIYVEDMAAFIKEVAKDKTSTQHPTLYLPVSESLTVAQMFQAYYDAYGMTYRPVKLPEAFWRMLRFLTGQKRLWERLFPHVLYNKIWQANILVSQAYWNESETIARVLGRRHLTTFREFCGQMANHPKEFEPDAIVSRDQGVYQP